MCFSIAVVLIRYIDETKTNNYISESIHKGHKTLISLIVVSR